MVNSYVLPEYGYWQKLRNETVNQYPDYTDLRFPKVNTTNPKVDLWLVDLASLHSNNNGIVTEHTQIHPPVSLTSNGEEAHFSSVVWADTTHFAVTWMNRVQVTYYILLLIPNNIHDCNSRLINIAYLINLHNKVTIRETASMIVFPLFIRRTKQLFHYVVRI